VASALHQAESTWLRRYIASVGGSITLTGMEYKALADLGLNRGAVGRAVDSLVEQGKARLVDSKAWGIVVELIREGTA